MLNNEQKLMIIEEKDIWRYAALQPRFIWIDYRVSFLGFIYFIDIFNVTLLYTFLITVVTLYIIEKVLGLSLPSALRKLHTYIVGINRNPFKYHRQDIYYD